MPLDRYKGLAGQIASARQAGYSDDEIEQYLSARPDLLKNEKAGAVETAKTVGRGLLSAAVDVFPSTIGRTIRGGDISTREGTIDRWIAENEAERQSRSLSAGDAARPSAIPGLTLGDIEGGAQSLGYSGASMVGGMTAGAAVGSAIPGAGTLAGAVGGALGAGAAGAGVGFRSSKDQFVESVFNNLRQSDPNLTEEKWQAVKKTIEDDADLYGFWEAAPEAVGNILTVGIIKTPVGQMLKNLPFIKNQIARTVASGTIKTAANIGQEVVTEGKTAQEQGRIDYRYGNRPDAPQDLVAGMREAGPQTVVTSALTLGLGSAANGLLSRKRAEVKDQGGDVLDQAVAGSGIIPGAANPDTFNPENLPMVLPPADRVNAELVQPSGPTIYAGRGQGLLSSRAPLALPPTAARALPEPTSIPMGGTIPLGGPSTFDAKSQADERQAGKEPGTRPSSPDNTAEMVRQAREVLLKRKSGMEKLIMEDGEFKPKASAKAKANYQNLINKLERLDALSQMRIPRSQEGQEVQGLRDENPEVAGIAPAQEEAPPIDRRTNLDRRRKVAEMAPEDMRRELLTSPLTGLGNRRAFEEAEPAPFVASIDADSLKFVNDTMGHEAGDDLLRKIGQALGEGYHFSGDEFVVTGGSKQEVSAKLARAQEALKSAVVSDGRRSVSPSFSFGIGRNMEEADKALRSDKSKREKSGLRATRGEAPPSLTVIKQRSETQKANDEKLRRERSAIDVERDDILKAISKLGGIDVAQVEREFGKTLSESARDFARRGVFGRPVFRKNGESLDRMAETLAGHGYLETDENGKADIRALGEALSRAARGEAVSSRNAQVPLDMPQAPPSLDDPFDFSDGQLEDIGYNDLNEAERAVYEEAVSRLSAVEDPVDFLERLAIRYQDLAESEYLTRAAADIEEAINERQGSREQDREGTGQPAAAVEEQGAGRDSQDRAGTSPAQKVGEDGKLFATPPTFGKGEKKQNATLDDMALYSEPLERADAAKQSDLFTPEVKREEKQPAAYPKHLPTSSESGNPQAEAVKRISSKKTTAMVVTDPTIKADGYVFVDNGKKMISVSVEGKEKTVSAIYAARIRRAAKEGNARPYVGNEAETKRLDSLAKPQQERAEVETKAKTKPAQPQAAPVEAKKSPEDIYREKMKDWDDKAAKWGKGKAVEQARSAVAGGFLGREFGEGAESFYARNHSARATRDWLNKQEGKSEEPAAPAEAAPAKVEEKAKKQAANPMVLTLVGVDRVLDDTRGANDKRYKVDQHIAEYRGSDGEAYMKSFVVKRGEKPNIPQSGTHEELNGLREQHLSPAPEAKPAAQGEAKVAISDLGEKIGGARKDISVSTGPKGTKAKEDTGWRSRYHISQMVVDASIRNGGMVDNPNKGKWAVYEKTKKEDRWNMPRPLGQKYFDTAEEAAEMLPVLAVAQKHSVSMTRDDKFTIYRKVGDRKRVQVIPNTFDTRDEAMRYMVENAEDILTTKLNFGEEILPKPETITRTGELRREGNVTGQTFMDALGFRAVEFGNWVSKTEERQEVMNYAYDSLLDMADILGIPPKAVSLNGELALAFGARGQGLSGAAAHYEPAYAVINLTKMAGAGHLAHEWFHAFDHYVGRLDSKASSEKKQNERGNMVYPDQTPTEVFATHGFQYEGRTKARKELRDAFGSFVRSMMNKGQKYVEDTKQAEDFLGRSRDELAARLKEVRDSLGRQLDPKYYKRNAVPASEEQLARIDQLAAMLINGESLETEFRTNPQKKQARGRLTFSGRHSNDILDEISSIYKDVRGRSGFAEKVGDNTIGRLVWPMKAYRERIAMLKDAENVTEKVKSVPTNFRMQAKAADQARPKDYWSSEHELAARAFAAYVEDKLAGQDANNDFLVYHAHGAIIAPVYPEGMFRPYPEGEERTAINAELDNLFSTIQTRETDKGTAMYAVEDQPGKGLPKDADWEILYRGEYAGNKSGGYFTGDREFARQFTQSGQDREVKTRYIRKADIYTSDNLAYAGDPDAVDSAIEEARAKGYKAVRLSEGEGQPVSTYVFDRSALRITEPTWREWYDDGSDIRYTTAPAPDAVTDETVRAAFPTATNIRHDVPTDWVISLPNGATVTVKTGEYIKIDEAAYRKGYGQSATGKVAVGEYRTSPYLDTIGIIRLAKAAGESTLDHEIFHLAMALALNENQRKLVIARFGSEEAAARAYEKWTPGKDNSFFQRIYDFFRNMLSLFKKETTDSIFRDIKSGKVWEQKGQGAQGVAYAGGDQDQTGSVVTLYHGTATKSANDIKKNGFNTKFVYLTTDSEAALDRFADGEDSVISIDVPKSQLLIDFDLGTDSSLLTVQSANDYYGEERSDWTIDDWLENWRSFAVKKDIANKALSLGNSDIRYQANQTFYHGTGQDSKYSVGPVARELFDVPEEHTAISAIKAAFAPSKFTRERAKEALSDARTKLIDKLHPIEQLGREPYLLHRMLGNAHLVISTFLQHGKLSWKDNALSVATKDKGFLPWLHALKDDSRNLFYWIAAKRAEKLEAEGRENWLTPEKRKDLYDEIFAGLSPQERTAKESRFEKLNDEFQRWNKNVLGIAKESGLLSQSQIDAWTKDYYLPFYRLMEDEATREEFLTAPMKSKRHISAQIKRLEGGEEKIGDPVENILRNWSHLIQESQRNKARSAAGESAINMGLAEVASPQESFKSPGARRENFIVSYQVDGKTTYLKVEDPMLFSAMSEVNIKAFDSKMMWLLGGAKRLLTAGATFSPAFRIANLLRDTLHTAVVSKSFSPFVDSGKGLVKVWKQTPEYIELMASGGGFGDGWVESGDPKAMARSIEKILKREGKGARGRILDSPRRVLEFWDRVGHASEMAARVQLYSNLKVKGETHLEAAFEARDLLDFHLSGASNAVRVLNAVTPFLNARVQGLDRLARGAKRDPKAFLAKGGLVAAASLLIWGLFKDDDRYKELEDWEKWQYHHFWIGDTHYRLPKAFEVGAIFSSLFESAASVMDGQEEFAFFGRFLGHTLTETFSLNMPAAFAPSMEVFANKSLFTGRPIENMNMQRLPAGERSKPWTPEVLKDLGKGLGISPLKMDHVLRGHTSTFGAMFLTVADAIYRPFTDAPEKPAMRIEDIPALGRFVRGEGATKYATRYYEFAKEVEELAATVNNYKKLGEFDKARNLAMESKGTLRYRTFINKVNGRLSDLRKIEQRVWMSDQSPEEKREELNKIQKQKNEIYRKAYDQVYGGQR